MLEVLSIFTQSYQLVEISDHIRRIFDLVLSSTLFESFGAILDSIDDMKVSPIKLEVLKCIALLSTGLNLFGTSDVSVAIGSD